MTIDGVLGSEAIDSSGEILDIAGADISDWEKGTMMLNFEHEPGEKGADTIVGVVTYAKKIFKASDCEDDRQRMYWKKLNGLPIIYGRARLFDGAGHENAKAIAAIIRDNAANNEPLVCRFSVEGSTMERKNNRLLETVIRRVAVTLKPANRTAFTGLLEDPSAPSGYSKTFARGKEPFDLDKMQPVIDFPGLGVEARTDTTVVTTKEQHALRERLMGAGVGRKLDEGGHHVNAKRARDSQNRSAEDILTGPATAIPAAAGKVTSMPGATRAGFVLADNLLPRQGTGVPGEFYHPNSMNTTVLHEDFHQVMTRVDEKYGKGSRQQVFKLLFAGLPQPAKEAMVYFAQHSGYHPQQAHFPEECIALLHNYLNNPGTRKDFHTRLQNEQLATIPPDVYQSLDTIMKQTYKRLRQRAAALTPAFFPNFVPTVKHEHPLYTRLAGATEVVCNPLVEIEKSESELEKATCAGMGGGVPSVGASPLSREDLRRRVIKAIYEYDAPEFKKEEFRAHLKHELPEASEDFLNYFDDIARKDFHVRKKLLKKEGDETPKKAQKASIVPKAMKPKAKVVVDEEDPSGRGLAHGSIRGIPTEPVDMKKRPRADMSLPAPKHVIDIERGILHTPAGSFPLYNPNVGFPVKEKKGIKAPIYIDGTLHVPPGTDMTKVKHNPPNPGFTEIYNSPEIEAFHSGQVMPNWTKVHELLKAGQLPEKIVMCASCFAMLSPNTPVRPMELKYAHMVDTWEDLGMDPTDPRFGQKKSGARKNWLDRDKGTVYPITDGDYFRGKADVHLAKPSVKKKRKAGELMSFMLGPSQFLNIGKYHQLHDTMVDLVRRHGIDGRSATRELMALKVLHKTWKSQRGALKNKIMKEAAEKLGLRNHASEYYNAKNTEAKANKTIDNRNGTEIRKKWRAEAKKKGLTDDLSKHAEEVLSRHPDFADYKGVVVPGLAIKTGRLAFLMCGAGNCSVCDTHFIRHVFGLDNDDDADTIEYLKRIFWEPKNHHLMEGLDQWYEKNHPAVKLMQEHPVWGQHFVDKKQAISPGFWRHWCCIAADERARGMANDSANEFSTHQPFWTSIQKYLNKSEFLKKSELTNHHLLPMMTVIAHLYETAGEIPAQMMFMAHVVPHILQEASEQSNVNKLQGLSVDVNHAVSRLRGNHPEPETLPYQPEVHSVDVKLGNSVHRAGRILIHNNQIHHLEDNHDMLAHLLPRGPMDQNAINRLNTMYRNPALIVRRDYPEPEPEKPEGPPEQAQPSIVPSMVRPPSVWEYQRAGMDRPHILEVKDGVYLLDGNQLDEREAQTILSNVRQGAGTLRYVSQGAVGRVQKMESTIQRLLKLEPSAVQKVELDDALQAIRQAVAQGHLDPKHERAVTKHLYTDPMTGGVLGNKHAAEMFLKKQRPGVYVMMDGTEFREINNTHGHGVGDSAIVTFGKYARDSMDEAVGRESGKLFRTPDDHDLFRSGGDEFLAYVPSLEHAAKFVRAFSQKLEEHPPIGGTHRLSMTFGIGLDHHAADAALYKAKNEKFHEGTTTRKFPVGQVPSMAFSFVPGHEGAIPTHDQGAAAVHHVLSDPDVEEAKPAKVGLPPAHGLAAA